MSVACGADGKCPFLYYCQTSTNNCLHQPVIPFTVYPLIIYLIFPLCSALCNLSGNSFGQYKVLMIMDLLNYSAPAATVLTYPLIAGTALFNFFNLIPKRHPTKNTSLVDYNIVMVLIPNILYGSTIGALVNFFIPQIASDAIVMPLLGAFSIKFFFRFRQYRQKQKQQNYESEVLKAKQMIQMNKISKDDDSIRQSKQQQNNNIVNEQQNSINQQNKSRISSNLAKKQQLRPSILSKQASYRLSLFSQQQQTEQNKPLESYKKKKILKYEQSWHIPHVIATILIFIIFQVVSFISQGKIFHFTICEYYYGIGIGCFTIFYLVFISVMYNYTSWQMKRYREIEYDYDGRLDEKLRYGFVCLSGFIGGFNAGVFGLASSTSMIFALLFLKIQPAVVSATIGFQVVFVGLATLGQAFVRQQIPYAVAGFFFGLTFVFGGILTFFFRLILKRFNVMKVNQVLMLIVCSLCGCSTLALIVNIILGFVTFGKNYMIDIKFSC